MWSTWIAVAAGADRPVDAPPPVGPPVDYQLQRFGLDDGLPQSSVTGIGQDRDGFLIVGTFGGLVSFDGSEFRPIPEQSRDLVSTLRFTAVSTDPDGRVFVGTQDGELAELVGGALVPIPVPPNLGVVRRMVSAGGELWLATDDSVHHHTAAGWTRLPIAAYALALGDDELWVAGPAGLGRIVGESVAWVPGTDGASDVIVRDGAPWTVGPHGLMVTDADGGAPHWVARPTTGEWRESHLTLDAADQVWVGDRSGVTALGSAEALLEGHAAAPKQWAVLGGIRAMSTDREGHLWVGTDGVGLVQVVPLPFRRHAFDDGDGPLPVRLLDPGGERPLVAPGCSGLRTVDGTSVVAGDRCVFALARGARDLWIAVGEGDGTDIVTAAGDRRIRVDARVVAMAEAADGALWIGTTHGAWVYRGGALARVNGADETAAAITIGRDGAVWIGQLVGLVVVRPSGVERIGRSRGMPRAQVRSIVLDDDGAAWVGTYGGGMARIADGQVTLYTRGDGLVEDVVSAIVDDGRGYLWLNGNRGVSRIPRADLLRFRAGAPSTVVRAILFPTGEGNGGAQPSAGRDPHGRLWFSTITGAVEIDPALPTNRVQPVAVIQLATVDGQSYPAIGGWSAPAGPRDLSVRYTAAVLGQPSLVRFRYRLVEVHEDWRDAGPQRQAEYTRLAPGRYTFEVQAANEDGLWSESKRLTFVLGASWSEQPLVRIIGVAASGGATIAVILGVFVRFDRRRAARALELQAQAERSAAAEAHAKTQEAYYRSVFEGASDGLLVCGADGVVRDANPAAERMFGSETLAVRGRSLDDLLQLDASRREGLPADREVGVRADGRTFLARVTRVHLADGQELTSVVDLTPLLELQERLAEAHRLEAVGRLAGGVAHDFNNLLTVARGSVAALRQQLGREGGDAVDQIEHVIARGAQVTRQLLAFGRRQQLRGEPIDVSAMVARLQGMLERLVEAPSTLAIEVASERAVVVADPTQMELTVVNLVINAADALARGGRITVTVNESPSAEARAQWPELPDGPEAWVVVSVVDDGAGIPAEVLPHVFEPFYTTKRGGSGLGLASVHGFVTQSNGHVTVSSTVGVGTRFDILLPRAPATAVPTPLHDDRVERPVSVLVCDDEPMIRRSVERALRSAGMNVRSAGNADEALAILAAAEIEVLVTDVSMPGTTGVELAARARVDQPGLRVVFVSGHLIVDDEVKLGGPVVQKPFYTHQLVAAVKRALEAR